MEIHTYEEHFRKSGLSFASPFTWLKSSSEGIKFFIVRDIGPPSTYRWLQKNNFNHVAYCVYGDNIAYQVFGFAHRVIILRSPSIADMFRRQFEFNWAAAETPWFARSHKDLHPSEPWSSAKAEAAREWINQSRSRARI